MKKRVDKCKICGGTRFALVYEGPIRIGHFGTLTSGTYEIKRCAVCSAAFLPVIQEDLKVYYESEAYRKDVDGGSDIRQFFRLHDTDQANTLSVIGNEMFREKILADIGCGAGAFLDLVKGYIRTGIGIEPSIAFRKSLSKRGYKTYPYTKDAVRDWKRKVDVVTIFNVIEHIEDPLELIRQAASLLTKGGTLLMNTPNADDVLLDAASNVYRSFFYRQAHLWYFNTKSLEQMLRRAGFRGVAVIPHQKYSLSNSLGWMIEGSPVGNKRYPFVTQAMDSVWKAELERTGKCDFLFAKGVLE